MPQNSSQHALATNATGAPSDGRKLLEEFHHYKGIVFRGWRFIVICVAASLTAAIIFLAAQKPTYKSSSRLLVIQQSGHPVHVGGGGDPFNSVSESDDNNLATHLLLLKSPVIIDQALKLIDMKSVSVGGVIGNLTVKQPDPDAKIIDLVYKSKSPDEARRVLDAVIESYKLFLKSNFQKNSSDVISLITKARNELNLELKSLEQAYLEYRQKNPAYSADSTGHTFVARRLDQWDQALNQFSARALQLQSQLELGKKMSREGVDPASIANALSQVGTIGANVQAGTTAHLAPAPAAVTNDGSYVGIAKELAEVESRRKMAELYLEHLGREHKNNASKGGVSESEIERAFLADPDVEVLVAKISSVTEQLKEARRVTRSGTDPAMSHHGQRIEGLKKQYKHLWETKRPLIEESLATANPDVSAGYRAAEAEVVALKARESALSDRLDQVAAEELQKLRQQRDQLKIQHGGKHPLVAQFDQRIAGIESRQQEFSSAPGAGNSNALIDYMAQSLASIEAMRGDLQKKFEEDLAISKKAEITLLEESNLRSNLERQRTLFNSVVDQLKQARLVSEYDSVSTQVIAPIEIAADQGLRYPLLFLALLVGAGLGSGVAYVADLVEARVRTLTEIRKFVDLPLIGVIPFIRDEQMIADGTAGLLSHHKPRSSLAESYKTTRTNLEFLRRSRQAQTLMVGSALPGDGKTTTVSNLAITLANTGRRILLIDGDLRKPSLHRVFEVARHGGLAEALLSVEPCDHLIRQTCVNNLELLTTGRDISNPAELLASDRLAELLKELRPNYDLILIDSPPLLLVTDPSIIAAVVDGIILVVKISSTRRRDLDVTNDMLKTLGVPVYGMVVNGVTREEFGYGYGYGYGAYYYGGYGYGKKTSPYGAPEEPRIRVNGTSPHEGTPGIGANGNGNGKHTHENGTADPV
jgi:capsular exopolysaccharide synthesis family protein